MSREVYSSVSGVGRSTWVSAGSRSAMGGSGESGRSAKSGTCFSFATRSLLGITTSGAAMRIGSCSSKIFLASSTFSSRTCAGDEPRLAVAPRLHPRAHRGDRPLDRGAHLLGEADPGQAGEDAEGGGEQGDEDERGPGEAQPALAAAPPAGRPPPRRARAAAPPSGCAARRASSALLDPRRTTKPASDTASERRHTISHASTRSYSRRIPQAPSATHHHAEIPNT